MDHEVFLEGIKAHPYATIIVASTINGRVAAAVVGVLIGQGYFDPFVAYFIFVTMDLLGDALYYFIGRVGQIGGKFLVKKSWQEKINQLDGELKKNLPKALLFGKISMIGSKPIVVAAGIVKMPLSSFLSINVSCTLVLFVLYMAVGYFFNQWIM